MGNRTDTFDRADGTIGTPSDGGSAWVDLGTQVWRIYSNTAGESTSGATAGAYLEASDANVEVQATITTVGGSAGLSARIADNNNMLLVNIPSGAWRLYKKVAGSFTQLGSTATVTTSTNDVVFLGVTSANAITVKQNGTSRITATDSAGSSNTKHGFYNNADTTTRWNDFTIVVAGGGGGGKPYYYYQQQGGG